MRIGKLRHAGTIDEYVEVRDEIGGVKKAWVEFSKTWCDILPLTGNEKYVSAEKHATATHQIYIRYVKDVTPKMRLISRGRTFEIKAALNLNERDKTIRLIVEEQVDD